MVQWTERTETEAKRRAAQAAQKERQLAAAELEREVTKATAEAAAEGARKARAEADAELVKLRRAVDTTALWYEDRLDTATAERDRCSGIVYF